MPIESVWAALPPPNIAAYDQSGRVMSRSIFALVIVMLATLPGAFEIKAATTGENAAQPANQRPLTTYERFLPLAVAGDPAIQHFLGYMFFYGEGVELNYEEARYWFHQAAEEGDSRAQHNLGIFHARAIARVPEKFYDASEANRWFSLSAANPENPRFSPLAAKSYDKFLASSAEKVELSADGERIGEIIYQGSCAGCHGFSGHPAYPEVPVFARGDRLGKSDRALADSILRRRGKMHRWDDTLSTEAAYKVVFYLRRAYGQGAEQEIADAQPPVSTGDDQLALGEKIYLRFCGGCHGFSGIAWYVNSPSFALRERMEKSDAKLTNSIKYGRGEMPSWEHMLKPDQIGALIQFIRTLGPTYEAGISDELRRPEFFLRFRPKSETGSDWTADDLR